MLFTKKVIMHLIIRNFYWFIAGALCIYLAMRYKDRFGNKAILLRFLGIALIIWGIAGILISLANMIR